MKAEDQILELLAEVLRKQDQTHEQVKQITAQLNSVEGRLGSVEDRLGSVEDRLGNVENKLDVVQENQQAHNQVLRTLATNQQKSQRELQNIVDILDTVARMQRDLGRRLDRLENPSDFV